MTKAQKLTTAQNRVYQAIVEHMSSHPYPPTTRELGLMLDLKAPSIYEQLKRLDRKGYIKLLPGLARGIQLLENPTCPVVNSSSVRSVPLLGEIAAGIPIMAEENRLGNILVDSALVGHGTLFALRVRGDSMINAGIETGDIVVIRQQPTAENGDIIAALLDREATVKQLEISDENGVRLIPANKKYKPIDVTNNEDFRILGKVVRTLHCDDSLSQFTALAE